MLFIQAVSRCQHVRSMQGENPKIPTNLTDLRAFLGLCNVFQRFVPNFAHVAAPLNEKPRKGQQQTFDGLSYEEETASETLKAKLIEYQVLALPRSQGDYTVDTGTFYKQIVCILLQKQANGTDRPMGYWYRTLNDAEKA